MQPYGTFGPLDYVLLFGVILFSLGVGMFYAYRDRAKRTALDYLMGGGKMPIAPVTLSLLASFMSALTLLGTPVEIYLYGTQYIVIAVSYVIMLALACHVYIPVFYRLGITSVFEYLEMRFARCVRTSASCICILQMTIYLAMVLYEPCLALAAVTGLNVWLSVFVVGLTCAVYTSIGGMKAVMWTDACQILLMFAAILAVLIQGIVLHNGLSSIWQASLDGGRIEFLNVNPNPTTRHTIWSLSIGGAFSWAAIYAVNQAQVQRAMSCPSLRNAQIAMWLNLPGLFLLMFLCALCGLVLYATYGHCDPISNQLVDAPDQMMPLFVMQYLTIPGLPGLFVAGLFSGALSTLSSGFSALSAIVVRDIVRNHFCPTMSDSRENLVSKIIAAGFGVLCTVLTLPISSFGQLLTAALGIFGAIGGPLLGVFTLGMLVPQANWKGAVVSLWLVLAFLLWITVGFYVYKPYIPKLPLYTDQCPSNSSLLSTSTSVLTTVTSTAMQTDSDYSNSIYALSYLWYSLLAVLATLLLGMLISWCTGMHKSMDIDPRLLCPPVAFLVKKYRGTSEIYLISPDDYLGGSISRSRETIATNVTSVADTADVKTSAKAESNTSIADLNALNSTRPRRPPRSAETPPVLQTTYTSVV